jgi:D-alanyl-lipoteichoic acid acyltransferase DltB (MBOAT superfamily)
MKFTSISFALFFLVVYLLYWNLKGRGKLVLLILASILFYSAWSPYFALHFLGLAILNYVFATFLFRNRSKVLLTLILSLNALNLFFFKYFYLFLDSLLRITGNSFFQKENFDSWLEFATGEPAILLPLAISFYTFVFIAYAVDVYKGLIQESEGFLEYFTFIFYFPHLVAGPIIRHSDFFYQLKQTITPDPQRIYQGCYLILQGLLKKIVLADNVFPIIHPVFANPTGYDTPSIWMALLGYSVRVYCDFSGYTDLARGISKCFGLELPENFRAPYLTTNVRTLWKRWHYTLSTWIRDYLYIPLGGSKAGEFRNNFNLFLAFTLGGLWHGANYTYVAWGGWNGFMVAIERKLSQFLPFLDTNLQPGHTNSAKVKYYLYLVLGFLFTQWVWLVGITFFNQDEIHQSIEMIFAMHNFQSGIRAKGWETILYMLIATFGFNYLQKIQWEGFRPSRVGFLSLFGFGLLTMIILGLYAPEGAEFIYFQF